MIIPLSAGLGKPIQEPYEIDTQRSGVDYLSMTILIMSRFHNCSNKNDDPIRMAVMLVK